MPEATAQLKTPILEKPVDVEKRLDGIRMEVGKSAEEALNEPHDPFPIGEKSPHVPEGITTNTTLQNIPRVEGSYGEFSTPLSPLGELSDQLAFANRLVTGEDKVTDKALRFAKHKSEKGDKVLAFKNQPKKGPGTVKRFIAWLHDESDDSNVIHAEDRFGAKKERAA